jgi:hypothetical protein
MSWAKLDDRFHGNRKVRRAWKRNRASIGLYVLALTYAAQHETDGIVDAEFIEDAMPAARERDAAVQTLIDCELWEAAGDGYRIHDYLEYQHSAAEADAKREQKAKRQAAWRARNASTDATTDASTPSHVDGPVDRAPTRPDPTPSRPDPTNPPLTPPAIARGELGIEGVASLANPRALGTNPRANGSRLAAAETAERHSLAAAALSKPNGNHNHEWTRLHSALIGAVTGYAEVYVTDLALVAVDGETLVVGGSPEAWSWATQRFRRGFATVAEGLGIPARIASLDEQQGLYGTDKDAA